MGGGGEEGRGWDGRDGGSQIGSEFWNLVPPAPGPDLKNFSGFLEELSSFHCMSNEAGGPMREAVIKAQSNCSSKKQKTGRTSYKLKTLVEFPERKCGTDARGSRKPSLGCDGVTEEVVFLAGRTAGALLTRSKNWKNWCFLFLLSPQLPSDGRLQPAQRRRRPGARPAPSLSGGGGVKKTAGTAGE